MPMHRGTKIYPVHLQNHGQNPLKKHIRYTAGFEISAVLMLCAQKIRAEHTIIPILR